MRKIFTVVIHGEPFDVFDIEGKEHEGLNNEPKTWWLYYSSRLPIDVPPPIDSDHWRPYHVSINRRLWDVKVKQMNTTKEKWNHTNFRNSTSVEMICNGSRVYEFVTTGTDSGLSFAFAKVQFLMVALSEHPFNFFEPELENGRKIYWKGLPAFVVSSHASNRIQIRPDYSELPKDEWWEKLDEREAMIGKKVDEDDLNDKDDRHDDYKRDLINWGDAFSDQYINWFRK